jgi:hypothetical protein
MKNSFSEEKKPVELIHPMDKLIHLFKKTGIVNTAFLRLFLEAKKK